MCQKWVDVQRFYCNTGLNRYIGHQSAQYAKGLMVKWLCLQIKSCDSCMVVSRVRISLGTLFNLHMFHDLIGHMAKLQPRLSNQNLTNILHTAGYNFTCYKLKFTNVWVQFPCQNLTSLTHIVRDQLVSYNKGLTSDLPSHS